MNAPQQSNYMKKVRRLIRTGRLPADFSLSMLRVAHDGWCPALDGGLCTCDPDVTVVPVHRRGQDN